MVHLCLLLLGLVLLAATGSARAHEGGLGNEVMWQACEGRQVDERCAFENADHDIYRGSCQAMSNALVCVRNQPIERHAGAASAQPHRHEPERSAGAAGSGRGLWPWLAGALVLLVGGLALHRARRKAAA